LVLIELLETGVDAYRRFLGSLTAKTGVRVP